jgi:glycosyltransferase involved in cell wall biosynthesis
MKIPHRYGVFGGFAPWLISPVFTKAIAKTQEIADWLTTQGVETAKISQFPIDLSYWRRDSYWQRKVPVVGYVGRTEGKNLKQLVSLAKKAGHNRVKLVVNDRVDTEGISKFGCEIVRNPTLVRQHYFEMDIFMMTSLIEGIPRVIMEAMAMSLPIVVFGIGGIPFLNPTYHFHPEDTDNLVKTLKELVLDCGKREEVGGINRKRIEEYDGQIRDSLKSWFDGLK